MRARIEMDQQRRTVTVVEAASVLGISRSLAYELVGRGELPSIRLGRRILIPTRALEAVIDVDGHESGIASEAIVRR